MARDFSKLFYKSKEWLKVREAALMRDRYLCVKCGRPAEEVHHIVHLTPRNINDPSITLNLDNLESLCKGCHMEEHRGPQTSSKKAIDNKIEYDYEFDANGYLVKKSCTGAT